MAAPESLEELLCLRTVPAERLDQVCSDDHLLELSHLLNRWLEVSPYLGLIETEEEDIEKRPPKRQRIDVLKKWRASLGTSATYRCVYRIN